ncbi:MAG: methyltransferase [Neomegalonema sp.]|nr:methyltransferase [Neomegalonema sp.]
MTDTDEDLLAEAYNRGLAAERAGDRAGAAAAYGEVLKLDPSDRGGVSVRLAALGLADAPQRAPEAYVAALFDQHSEVFDSLLVDQLGYDVPLLMRERLLDVAPGPYEKSLDLGCGTGLSTEAVEDVAKHRTGVDMSTGMLEAADEKELFDTLFVGDAEGFLSSDRAEAGAPWDLIIALDMLPYLGDLKPLFDGVARRITSKGVFAFSSETLPDEAFEGRDWRIGPKQRFAHRLEHLRALLSERGFEVMFEEMIVVRYDEGDPVPGHLILARAAG